MKHYNIYLFIYITLILITITNCLINKSYLRQNKQLKLLSTHINWSPDSWTKLPVKQPPNYPDQVNIIIFIYIIIYNYYKVIEIISYLIPTS